MTIKTLAAAAIATAGLAACAGGGGPGAAGRDNQPIRALLSADALMFVSFDADDDLRTTNAEVEAGLAREFARADTSGDGVLQPIEFQNWSNAVLGGAQMGPYRLDFDRNVDNVITREEFAAEITARMRDYDENQDGAGSRAEFVRLVGQARPPTPQRAPIGQPMRPQR